MERPRTVEKQEEGTREPDESSPEEEPSEEKKILKRIFSFY